MGRLQSANKKFVRARGHSRTFECRICLNDRELAKTAAFEKRVLLLVGTVRPPDWTKGNLWRILGGGGLEIASEGRRLQEPG